MNKNEIKTSRYTQFQKIALQAYHYMRQGKLSCPNAAWTKACKRLKINTETSDKRCPRLAFIGLVEHNCLRGLPKVSSVHTNSKNAEYARILAGLYKNGSILKFKTKKAKWEFFREQAANAGLNNVAENNNGQLDVVEVFYEEEWLK